MALTIDTRTGPVINSDGPGDQPLRQSRTSAIVVTDAHPRYYEGASRQNTFFAANQAAVTFGAGLSATVATYALYNPLNSGVNLALLSWQFTFSAAPAAAVVVWLVGNTNRSAAAPTGTTALTVQSALVGGSSGRGQAFSAATLPAAPVIFRTGVSVVAASSITPAFVNDEIAGQISVPPGIAIAIQASAAASGFISMVWEEVAI